MTVREFRFSFFERRSAYISEVRRLLFRSSHRQGQMMTIVAVCNVGVMVFISRVSPYCRRGRIAGASELYTFSLLYTVMAERFSLPRRHIPRVMIHKRRDVCRSQLSTRIHMACRRGTTSASSWHSTTRVCHRIVSPCDETGRCLLQCTDRRTLWSCTKIRISAKLRLFLRPLQMDRACWT